MKMMGVVTALIPFPAVISSVAAMSTAATTSTSLRVVSYNLLSSKLAQPSHYTHAEPEHLEPEYRLPLILSKLDDEMKRGFGGTNDEAKTQSVDPPPSIFALQEVCYPFASKLHTFFAQRGYHFIYGPYGKKFNGYMGVGIAYPMKDFTTVNVDICRLSDERCDGWPREKRSEGGDDGEPVSFGRAIQKFSARIGLIAFQTIQGMTKHLGYNNEKPPIDPWEMSENRYNVLVTVTLRPIAGGSTFSVSNYHMPCAYFAPAVMNIHTEMVAKRVQDLAAVSWKNIHGDNEKEGDNTIPYILTGDFNILPESAQYKILTSGMLEQSDPTFPPTKHGKQFKVESVPMDSAYALLGGSEPEFTNYAHCRDDPPFIGTLDYIFMSKSKSTERWKVHRTKTLPNKETSGGPFPGEKEPSDHLLIAADLELVSS